MNHSQITLRYAKALFDLSLETKILDKVNADMALIDKVCSENRELRGMLQNPVISADKKQKVMEKIFFGNIQETDGTLHSYPHAQTQGIPYHGNRRSFC